MTSGGHNFTQLLCSSNQMIRLHFHFSHHATGESNWDCVPTWEFWDLLLCCWSHRSGKQFKTISGPGFSTCSSGTTCGPLACRKPPVCGQKILKNGRLSPRPSPCPPVLPCLWSSLSAVLHPLKQAEQKPVSLETCCDYWLFSVSSFMSQFIHESVHS